MQCIYMQFPIFLGWWVIGFHYATADPLQPPEVNAFRQSQAGNPFPILQPFPTVHMPWAGAVYPNYNPSTSPPIPGYSPSYSAYNAPSYAGRYYQRRMPQPFSDNPYAFAIPGTCRFSPLRASEDSVRETEPRSDEPTPPLAEGSPFSIGLWVFTPKETAARQSPFGRAVGAVEGVPVDPLLSLINPYARAAGGTISSLTSAAFSLVPNGLATGSPASRLPTLSDAVANLLIGHASDEGRSANTTHPSATGLSFLLIPYAALGQLLPHPPAVEAERRSGHVISSDLRDSSFLTATARDEQRLKLGSKATVMANFDDLTTPANIPEFNQIHKRMPTDIRYEENASPEASKPSLPAVSSYWYMTPKEARTGWMQATMPYPPTRPRFPSSSPYLYSIYPTEELPADGGIEGAINCEARPLQLPNKWPPSGDDSFLKAAA